MKQNEGVRPEHFPAVIALATGATQEEAGKQIGLSRHAIMRWALTPAWKDAIRLIRDNAISQIAGKLSDAAAGVVEEMYRIALYGKRECDRIAAGKVCLEYLPKFREAGDLLDQLKEMQSGRATKPEPDPSAVLADADPIDSDTQKVS